MRRPYVSIDRTGGPRDSYDVVIIGAGIGGLTCANLLARQGLRVLLVEQHYMVGGYCSTFRRRGYTFDAATHFYPLLGNTDTITGRLLADLGVEVGWVKMNPVDQFHLPDGSTFAVPADFGRYRAKLKAEFPHEAGAIDEFFALVREVSLLGILAYFRGRELPQVRRYRPWTVRQVLDRTFLDPKLALLLTADCPHWGSPPSRTSFLFDSMLRVSYFLGNYYPRGGSQAFADSLAGRFVASGGHILLRASARRILVRDGEARGVELEVGPPRGRRLVRIVAGAVVSNADLRLTLERLLGPELVEPETLAAVRRLRPSSPCFLTHIGLRGVPAESLARLHGYHWNGWDSDLAGLGALTFKAFVPTLYEPSLAPEGGHVLIIQKVTDLDYGAVADWPSHKAAVERYVLTELDQLLPGFRSQVEVVLSASAATSHRYTLNHDGAMLGWEMSPEQLGEGRPGVLGPVPRLFLVGHWTRPGGGITPVIISAMQAAEAVLGSSPAGPEPTAATVPHPRRPASLVARPEEVVMNSEADYVLH